uniref:HDC11903 n=1 Tax=Drosophila melanogaster TaxID=7227 RepID=Q6IKP6_DROME|nr:TPA_inf: HDC11903 [Drosophila melanogaster]
MRSHESPGSIATGIPAIGLQATFKQLWLSVVASINRWFDAFDVSSNRHSLRFSPAAHHYKPSIPYRVRQQSLMWLLQQTKIIKSPSACSCVPLSTSVGSTKKVGSTPPRPPVGPLQFAFLSDRLAIGDLWQQTRIYENVYFSAALKLSNPFCARSSGPMRGLNLNA